MSVINIQYFLILAQWMCSLSIYVPIYFNFHHKNNKSPLNIADSSQFKHHGENYSLLKLKNRL